MTLPSRAADRFVDDEVECCEDDDGADLCRDERVDRVEDGPVEDVGGVATKFSHVVVNLGVKSLRLNRFDAVSTLL